MKYIDFSPPASPSLNQQRDALQKGLGRAKQWAIAGCLADEPLLEACLHDKRFDRQCEESRGKWLWTIIVAAGAIDRFRKSILVALRGTMTENDACQLCELAFHYAQQGDSDFHAQLYELVKQKPVVDSPWIGEEQILELDGEEAFRFIARSRGQRLENQEWDWDDDVIVDSAIKKLTEERVSRLLSDPRDTEIFRFGEVWRKKRRVVTGSQTHSHAARNQAIPVDEILAAAQATKERYASFRGWGMYAGVADLELVLQRLWETQEPHVIANLLRVFSNRPVPRFDPRLIELCDHDNQEVRRFALKVLEQNSHPLVREFALRELHDRSLGTSVIGLFVKNYEKGDEQRILEQAELPEDADERHWMLMDIIDVLETNLDADCSQLGVLAYAETPCENCRFWTVKLLVKQRVAPEWLVEECRHDSAEDCRAFIELQSPAIGRDCSLE